MVFRDDLLPEILIAGFSKDIWEAGYCTGIPPRYSCRVYVPGWGGSSVVVSYGIPSFSLAIDLYNRTGDDRKNEEEWVSRQTKGNLHA